MNHNEENNYKEYAKETTPDLWERIDSNLPDGMYTKDSSIDTKSDTKPNKIVRFSSKKIYAISSVLAACLVIATLTIVYNESNEPYRKDTSNISGLTNNSNNKSVVDDDTNNKSNISDSNSIENSDESASNDLLTDNTPTNETIKEDDNMTTITLTVTKHHTTDIGLVYEGIITSSNTEKLAVKRTVYVTLRRLSRHDLLHTYTPKESFTISIEDYSYTSTANNPYYATKLIK